MGLDRGDLAGLYPHGRRPPEGVGGSVHQGDENDPEPPERSGIDPLDFSDDRLGHLLKHFSKPKYWHAIEEDLNAHSIEVYALPQDVIRCDATTVSGDHDVREGGLLQFGHSKDDPSRPQIKVMTGSLDPLGMPLATDVLSGERADDGLYIPLIERIASGLNTTDLLVVGDCKMSALATRAYVATHQHFYLASPLDRHDCGGHGRVDQRGDRARQSREAGTDFSLQ